MSAPSSNLTKHHRVPIDFSDSGDNTLVAAVAGKRIAVHKLWLRPSGSVNMQFFSGASSGGNDLTGVMNDSAAGGIVLPWSPVAWIVTDAGDPLVCELDSAVQCGGVAIVSYVDDFDDDPSS